MKLTIIEEDQIVCINGHCLRINFALDTAIHAVQWDGEKGEIEYKDGRLNEPIDNITSFQAIVDLYDIELSRIEEQQRIQDEAEAQEQAERDAFELTYVYQRQQAYPEIGDQLDMLWHSMDAGEIDKSIEFYDAVRVVKDEYPKNAVP